MTINALSKLLNRLIDAAYPKDCVCALCDCEAILDGHYLCAECKGAVIECDASDGKLPHLDGLAAGMRYTPEVRSAIHRFKFKQTRHLADFFASYMVVQENWRVDVIIPVPLHKKRQIERGYNQSELLAKRIAVKCGLPVSIILLKRVVHTPQQSRMESIKARRENVKGAFSAIRDCEGLNVLLIDDVCTTGSTLSECAKALKASGACKVYGLTACRTEYSWI